MDPTIQIRKTNTPDSHPVGIGLAGWVLWLRESDAQQSMLGTSLHSANVTPNPSSRVTQMSPRLAALCLPIPILPRTPNGKTIEGCQLMESVSKDTFVSLSLSLSLFI